MRRFVPLLLTLAITTLATAQIDDPAGGLVPFSTRTTATVDSVDLATSNIFVRIPVRTKTGKVHLSYSLVGNFHVAIAGGSGVPASIGINPDIQADTEIGNRFPGFTLHVVNSQGGQCGTHLHDEIYTYTALVDGMGTWHSLPSNLQTDLYGCLNPLPPVTYTTDGSGITALTAPHGSPWTFYNSAGDVSSGTFGATDPDRTVLTQLGLGPGDNIEDSLWLTGQPYFLTYSASGNVWNTDQNNSYAYTDASGGTRTFTTERTSYTIKSNFGCSIPDYPTYPPEAAYLVTTIVTPIGNYRLSYEKTPGSQYQGNGTYGPYSTGRIAKITLPTGGYVQYGYSGGNAGFNCTSGVVPTLTRTVSDNLGNIRTWTYVNANTQSGSFTVTETDPANNQTVYTFGGEYQEKAQYYEGTATGTPLKTVVTCYNGHLTDCGTYIPGVVSQTDVYTSFSGSSSNLVETKFDTYGNTTEVKRYDFGAAMPPSGNPLSDTLTYYGQSWNGTACTAYPSGTYIYNTPCYSHTMNSSGTDVAKTQITYSNTGHPTSTAKWVTGSSWLTSTATFNSNGTVNIATDTNSATSTYAYTGTGGCNSFLPTSVTAKGVGLPAGGLTTSTQWDCNGGVLTSSTDSNGQITKYGFLDQNGDPDPLWRRRSVTDPLNNITWTNPSPGGTLPATVETILSFNNGASAVDNLTTLDGIGRPILQQTRQAPGSQNFDTTVTAYDLLGRVSKVGIPCVSTASLPCTSSVTTTTYDAISRPLQVTDGGSGYTSYGYNDNDVLVTLGPPPTVPVMENTKKRQLEYDGLGRLTSVCEITAGTSTWPGGNCAQTIGQTGFWTKYTYSALNLLIGVTENAQGTSQTRSYAYDDLGRLTSETNPELGPGTTTYTYDTDSKGVCSTSKGDLVKRVDYAGNTSCYTYDSIHRMLSTAYSGPNATANRYFVYDGLTQVNGQAMGYPLGRMTEGYTATCATCTKITDEGFGYNQRGDLSDFYEATANSGGYYHVPMTYWANGLLETFGPFLTEDQIGYVPDGEGRAGGVYDFTVGGYSVPNQGISYNAASQPTTIETSCYGTTCYPISYTYDPNTLRMTQYGAALANGTISGTLTWNANGSLQQLVVADPFNTADVQTCNYSADDLSRIASVNCMNGTANVWAQNFSHDPFGNVTKQVPSGGTGVTWTPGYSSTTNRYTLGGTSYDGNGNVLNDGSNIYTWDAEGKTLSTAYSEGGGQNWAFTYDAFGHLVELSTNGNYVRSYVNVGNFKLTATAQSAGYSQTPLPGGSSLSQNGGATGVELADWLGTIRAFYTYTGGGFAQSGAHAPFGEAYSYNAGYPEAFTGQGGQGWGLGGDGSMNNTTYWFPERQYRSSQGRWLSPDPAGLDAADPRNPQSWNRYAYVLNNPLSAVDPDGLWCVWEDGTHDDDPGNGGADSFDCATQGGHWDRFDTITGIFQDGNGNVTQINYKGGSCTTPDCGAGGTLEQLDRSLTSYSVLPSKIGWTGSFWGSFLSRDTFQTAWRSTWEEGGCDNLMFSTFLEDFNPLPTGEVSASDLKELAPKVAGKAILTGATAYSIAKGLTVPLRSSIYRGIRANALSNSAAIEEAAPYIQLGFATADAINTAGMAAYNGECH